MQKKSYSKLIKCYNREVLFDDIFPSGTRTITLHHEKINTRNTHIGICSDCKLRTVHQSDSASTEIPDRIEGKEERLRTYLSVSFPLKKILINSKFGMRKHPVYHKYMMHNGLDLHARHEEVLSMLPGKVLRVGYDSRSGKYVTVQTANYTVSYCHLSEQYVKPNDYLHAGEPLGLTGSTGASTGEHLHLTTKKDGKAFDPTILLNYIRSIRE